MGHLEAADLSRKISKADEADRLPALQKRLLALRLQLGGKLGDGALGPPLLVVFEGWDASGKGGAIQRLVGRLDPRHVRVAQFAAPTPDEKRHHFLLRFSSSIPGWGGMAVLDRSWYGRVLVERVEGFASEDEWRRAYDEIAAFERGLVEEGVILLKLWMHVSEKEQLRRFEARRDDPLKCWKLTDEDWRNRERRADYEQAVDEMIDRTSMPGAPWHVVEGESKRYGRLRTLELAIAAVEEGMRRQGIEPVPLEEEG